VADGPDGQNWIARTLNAEGALAPRSQQGRPPAWSPTAVHDILFRDLYRGVVTWNRTQAESLGIDTPVR